MKLKILINTVLKHRPVQSFELGYNKKVSAYVGTEFEIESYTFARNNHLKVKFAAPFPRNQNIWYIFAPHVQIITENDTTSGDYDPNLSEDQLVTSPSGWRWPMRGNSMGQRTEFGYARGRLHAGVDIGGFTPDECYAASNGTVTYIKNHTGGAEGRMIEITRSDGWKHCYLHLRSILIQLDETIEIGQLIAIRGGSGFGSEGLEIDGGGYSIHLHFEIRTPDGNPINPRTVLPDDGSVPILGY